MEDKLTVQAANLANRLIDQRTALIYRDHSMESVEERLARLAHTQRLRNTADRAIARTTRRFLAACKRNGI